jgi:predicted membrane channel-forming protein YqfA (hemolysin III family)
MDRETEKKYFDELTDDEKMQYRLKRNNNTLVVSPYFVGFLILALMGVIAFSFRKPEMVDQLFINNTIFNTTTIAGVAEVIGWGAFIYAGFCIAMVGLAVAGCILEIKDREKWLQEKHQEKFEEKMLHG